MNNVRIANIVYGNDECALHYPGMYCKASAPIMPSSDRGFFVLEGKGTFDFTTYFNSLSVLKLRRYTKALFFGLHLELKGEGCEVSITRADAYSRYPDIVSDVVAVEAANDWSSLDVELPVDDQAIVMGFSISTQGRVEIKNSYYYAQVESKDLSEVELAIVTTTFKKERYVIPNIERIRSEIIESRLPYADRIHLYVVDNGRTLDAASLESRNVAVIPNPNAGGSGGFARGMIEALKQDPKATHVLLMDDDISVSPESIKRTYSLLTILNDEYRDAFIGGAMLNYEIGDVFLEDVGYMTKHGSFSPVKSNMRMSVLHEIVLNERWVPSEEQRRQMYASWWYCCIPTATIERNGLPLPLFVRCDDAEYSLRCKPRFITMNGICVWHMPFHSRYSAAVERYQTTRNTLIAQAVTGFAPESDFMQELDHNIRLELSKFNYVNAELVLDGLEDYLKGPDFIMSSIAEDRFMAANKKCEKLEPLDVIVRKASDMGIDVQDIAFNPRFSDVPRSRIISSYDRRSVNGQRLVKCSKKGKVAVVPAEGWANPAGELHGAETVVAIDAFTRQGAIRRKDVSKFRAAWNRYKKDLKEFERRRAELVRDYSSAREAMTSLEFWKSYLDIR